MLFLKSYGLTLVYNFLCGNCNVTSYGKTERYFNVRSSGHIGILYLTGKRVEYKPSPVSDQFLLHNHDSDFSDFKCRDNNGFRLLLNLNI